MTGWLKIYRTFFEHELWLENRVFSKAEAWLDLLRMARYEEEPYKMLVGNQTIEVMRGEVAVSLRYLAQRWGWSKTKVGSFAGHLFREGMIKTRTADGTQQTVITICNYDSYNPIEEDSGTLRRTPRGHLADTTRTKQRTLRKKEDSSSCCSDDNSTLSLTNQEAQNSKNWRTDFETYRDELKAAYHATIKDEKFMAEQQELYPRVDVAKTLRKSITAFWGTESGWANKKGKRTKKIDWRSTFANAIGQSFNQILYDEPSNNPNPARQSKRAERASMVAEILHRNGRAQGADFGRHSDDVSAEMLPLDAGGDSQE